MVGCFCCKILLVLLGILIWLYYNTSKTLHLNIEVKKEAFSAPGYYRRSLKFSNLFKK